MRRGLWLLLLPAPAFSLSAGVSALLPELAITGAQIAGMMLLFHASIAGVKMLHLNFMADSAVTDGPVIEDFTKFSPVTSGAEWSEMSTHLDHMVEGGAGEIQSASNDIDHDPGLRFGEFELDDSIIAGSGNDWEH